MKNVKFDYKDLNDIIELFNEVISELESFYIIENLECNEVEIDDNQKNKIFEYKKQLLDIFRRGKEE